MKSRSQATASQLEYCQVTDALRDAEMFGPSRLEVVPLSIDIPSSGSASRYPSTITVFGQGTNSQDVSVILDGLYHTRPDDLDILLVSPAGKKVMLLSDAGGTNAVTNAVLSFESGPAYGLPPDEEAIPSHTTTSYKPSNHGTPQETSLPGAPAGPYTNTLYEAVSSGRNGTWKLYIYDDNSGHTGALLNSWRLRFTESPH